MLFLQSKANKNNIELRYYRIKKILAFFVLIPFLVSCSTGHLQVKLSEDIKIRQGALTATKIALRGVPRDKSNIFQEDLEMEIYRVMTGSKIFSDVSYGEKKYTDVDFIIDIELAELTYTRSASILGILLSLGTLTFYIWFGGTIHNCTENYGISLKVNDSDDNHLFNISLEETQGYSINIYHEEYPIMLCTAEHSSEIIDQLITKLTNRLSPTPEFSE